MRRGLAAGVLAALTCGVPQPGEASPASVQTRTVRQVPVTVVVADLRDPDTLLVPLVAGLAAPGMAPLPRALDFDVLAPQLRAAAVVNGTYVVDRPVGVFGALVQAGALVAEAYEGDGGTTLGLGRHNVPEMLTGPKRAGSWRRHWMSIQAGPRLLSAGRPDVLGSEGFHDPAVVYGSAGRTAIGFDRPGRRLFMVSFHRNVTREEAAAIMKDLGAWEAMGLDGGGSRGMAVDGKLVARPTRFLSNVLALFDARHPAPEPLRRAFRAYVTTRFVTPGGPAAIGGRRDVWSASSIPVDYGGWRFSSVLGDGVPHLEGDRLAIAFDRASRAFAAWPAGSIRPAIGPRYALHYEARLEGPYHALFFDASPDTGTPRTNGLALIYGEVDGKPPGLHLFSERGQGFWPGFAPRVGAPEPVDPPCNPPGTPSVPLDRAWHAFDVRVKGMFVEDVRLDGRTIFRRRPRESGHLSGGIILAGFGSFRGLTVTPDQ